MNILKNILQYNGNLIKDLKIGKYLNVIHSCNIIHMKTSIDDDNTVDGMIKKYSVYNLFSIIDENEILEFIW